MSLRTRAGRSHNRLIHSFILAGLILSLSSCHVARYFYWNFADTGDAKKFPSLPVRSDSLHHSLIPFTPNVQPDVPVKFNDPSSPLSFPGFLEKNHTTAFLIIRNDTMIYRWYSPEVDSAALFPAFSVAKSFVSALAGIAISEGYIKDIRDPVTKYLPELKDPRFGKVTIQDLLTMRSGIKFEEGYADPFGEMAKFYYGLNLRKYTLKLKIQTDPDSVYDYQSGNTQLLAMVIEKATGRNLAEYMQEKLWIPMGMESDATWNTDSKKHMEVKAFCCINARAPDFARFGLLYLHHGYWNGRQIVPEQWVKESLKIRNTSLDSQGYPYGYMWRTLEDGSFFAKGILGQYIFVDPARKIVIVHCGSKSGKIVWVEFFRELVKTIP